MATGQPGPGGGAGRFPALFEPRVIFPEGNPLPDSRAWAPREPGLLPMQVKGGPFLLSPSTSPDALLEKTPFKKGSRQAGFSLFFKVATRFFN